MPTSRPWAATAGTRRASSPGWKSSGLSGPALPATPHLRPPPRGGEDPSSRELGRLARLATLLNGSRVSARDDGEVGERGCVSVPRLWWGGVVVHASGQAGVRCALTPSRKYPRC